MDTAMRVGLTFDLAGATPLGPGEPVDRDAELDDAVTITAIEAALHHLGHHVERIGNLSNLIARLARGPLDVDMVLNLAEGVRGRGREAQVPALLEAYGVPYTGADPVVLAVALDKGLTKRMWSAAGLPTVAFDVVRRAAELEAIRPVLPSFVKPVAEGSSMGIDEHARVDDVQALRARVRYVWRWYRQPAMVEPFLPGPEYTVAILDSEGEARVLGALETAAHGVLRSRHAKRESLAGTLEAPFRPIDDARLEAELADLALRAYHVVGGRDVARVDLRCDAQGVPHLLEINPLPGLVPERSPLPLIAERAGMTYPDLIGGIMGAAVWRHRRRADGEEPS